MSGALQVCAGKVKHSTPVILQPGDSKGQPANYQTKDGNSIAKAAACKVAVEASNETEYETIHTTTAPTSPHAEHTFKDAYQESYPWWSTAQASNRCNINRMNLENDQCL